MQHSGHLVRSMVTTRTHDTSLFVALELSKSTWLIAASIPGNDRVSKFRVDAADRDGLLSLLTRLKAQAERCCREAVRVVSIYEAGLDGFWVHRLLEANEVESYVVD